jgi:hypothetical protein
MTIVTRFGWVGRYPTLPSLPTLRHGGAYDTATKRIHHAIVGDLELTYETMALSADSGLTMTVYTAEPGSASQDALAILAGWTATPDHDAAGR